MFQEARSGWTKAREAACDRGGRAQDKNLALFCSDCGARGVTEMLRGRQRVEDM